jgi:hypothetical protein
MRKNNKDKSPQITQINPNGVGNTWKNTNQKKKIKTNSPSTLPGNSLTINN